VSPYSKTILHPLAFASPSFRFVESVLAALLPFDGRTCRSNPVRDFAGDLFVRLSLFSRCFFVFSLPLTTLHNRASLLKLLSVPGCVRPLPPPFELNGLSSRQFLLSCSANLKVNPLLISLVRGCLLPFHSSPNRVFFFFSLFFLFFFFLTRFLPFEHR